MLDESLTISLNSQYTFERYSEAVYQALAVHLDYLNMVGMAAYMRKRAGEEHAHAGKFAEYLVDRNAVATVAALEAPQVPTITDTLLVGFECFQKALEHERVVTSRIEALYQIADEVEDGRTCVFLHWFLAEQVEEEKSLEEILTRFKLASGNGAAILIIDKALGE